MSNHRPHVLVLYQFSPDAQNVRLANLRFFVHNGITRSVHNTATYRVAVNDYNYTAGGVNPPYADGGSWQLKPHVPNSVEANGTHAAIALLEHHNAKREVPVVHCIVRPNAGYDFGSHLDSLVAESRRLGILEGVMGLPYGAYIFLNCGTIGPLVPSYMPTDWHWTDGFVSKLTAIGRASGGVALCGTSIVCLPTTDPAVKQDASFYGPKVEGFAFAITNAALRYNLANGSSFQNHVTKDDTVISGEYNLPRNTLLAPQKWNIAALLTMYEGMDWRHEANWDCNGNRHPSRAKAYSGMSINPFEVIFHKPRWANKPDVALEETNLYTRWRVQSKCRRARTPHCDDTL